MTTKDPRPAGVPWLIPNLIVADMEASVAFYVKAFGFAEKRLTRDENGHLLHAELTYHDAQLMLIPEGTPANPAKTPATAGATCPIGLYLYHPDLQALHQQASAAGSQCLMPPTEMFWGDQITLLSDPNGYAWTFACNVASFEPAQIPAS